jgi:ubiquinone/menaquinone biosynthesis C-methylase UbiE
VQKDYDAHAWRYDLVYADRKSRLRHALLERAIIRMTASAERVLEIGCGTGRLMRKLRGKEIIGMDVSRKSLDFARAKGLQVLQADAHRLPFAVASFDAVVAATGVLTYLDYDSSFAEFSRVLTAGGWLAVHQFAAHTVHIRNVARSAKLSALHLRDVRELDEPALRAGLRPGRRHYFRTLRIPPYLLPVPGTGSLWSHVIAFYRKLQTPTRPPPGGGRR